MNFDAKLDVVEKYSGEIKQLRNELQEYKTKVSTSEQELVKKQEACPIWRGERKRGHWGHNNQQTKVKIYFFLLVIVLFALVFIFFIFFF